MKNNIKTLWLNDHNQRGGFHYWESLVSNDPNCITEYGDFSEALPFVLKSDYDLAIKRLQAALDKCKEQRDMYIIRAGLDCEINSKLDDEELEAAKESVK